MKQEVIEKICYTGGCNRTVHYREIYRENGRSFKIDIDTDDSNPSSAYLRILEGTEWNVLYTIPDERKHVQDIKYERNKNDRYYQDEPMTALEKFQVDVEELKTKGRKILGY